MTTIEKIHPYTFIGLPTITPTDIIEVVASNFGVATKDLISRNRLGKTVEARCVCIALMRLKTSLRLVEIGKILGNRDHSTIIYNIDVFNNYHKPTSFLEKRWQLLKHNYLSNNGLHRNTTHGADGAGQRIQRNHFTANRKNLRSCKNQRWPANLR